MEKTARKVLETKISAAITEVLKKENSAAAFSIEKNIKEHSKTLAKKFAKHLPKEKSALEKATVSSVTSVSAEKANGVAGTKKPAAKPVKKIRKKSN